MPRILLCTAIDAICERIHRHPAGESPPFVLILGAGVSVPSIPLAPAMTAALQSLAEAAGRRDAPDATSPLDQYEHWFRAAFPEPRDRQQYLESLMRDARVTTPLLQLAHLLISGALAGVALTTNFDDLLTKALQILGSQPIVCDHPATAARIELSRDQVQIVHVHGSYNFYDACNLRGEVETRAENAGMRSLVDRVVFERTPILLGYSGWKQDVIMRALEQRLAMGPLPNAMYWLCHTRGSADDLPDWLKNHANVNLIVPPDVEEVPSEQIIVGADDSFRYPTRVTPSAVLPPLGQPPTLTAYSFCTELIAALGLQAPDIAHDPFAFYARSLERGLVLASEDPYALTEVIAELHRASDGRGSAPIDEPTRVLMNLNNGFRRGLLREAATLIGTSDLTPYDDAEIRLLMQRATAVAGQLSDTTGNSDLRRLVAMAIRRLADAYAARSFPPVQSVRLIAMSYTVGVSASALEGEWADVIDQYGRFQEEVPDTTDAVVRLQAAGIAQVAGYAYAQLGENESAVAAYRKSISDGEAFG